MADARPSFTNFTAGELSPRLEGRVDLSKYFNGASTLENYLILPEGGATRRAGTRYIAEVKDSAKKTRLVPFQFSSEQAYVLEFGNLYIRFYKDGGRIENPPGTPVEVVSPYTEADLFDLHFAQSADELYIAHQSYEPRRLTRLSHTSWTLSIIKFDPPPSYEADTDLNTTLTPAATTGNGITFTAGAAVFLASDVDRQIKANNGGLAVIRTVTTPPSATCTADIIDDFPDVNPIAAGQWFLTGSPVTGLTPDKKEPIGATATLTLAAGGWRSNDVGKFVRVHGGTVKITTYTSPTVVSGLILSALTAVTQAAGGSWTLGVVSWDSTRKFPSTVSFFEERQAWAASKSQPQTWWLSKTNKWTNYALGAADDDAIEFTIAAKEVNPIRWLVPTRTLLIGTAGGEFRATGGQDKALTPTNIDLKSETTYGSNKVAPVRVGSAVLFLQRAGQVLSRKLRELAYSFETDAYNAPDMTRLSQHVTKGGITQMAYAQEPDSVIWAIRADGTLLALTYLRPEEVVAWTRHISDGLFESVASIPHTTKDYDEVWAVVKRTINGATKRYVEVFEPQYWQNVTWGGVAQDRSLHVDCGLTYDGAAATVFSGLDHLKGKTVKIVGDGAVYPDQAVPTSAPFQVTIDPSASKVEIGLGYTSKLVTVRPEVSRGAGGTSQGKKRRWARIVIRLLDTIGMKVNSEYVPFRSAAHFMGQAIPPFTGDIELTKVGWNRTGKITIEQDQPLPQTVLFITGDLEVGE